MTLIVGFSGQAGVGKSTAAGFLLDGKSWQQFSFADPLKSMVSVLLECGFCYTFDESEDYVKNRKHWAVTEIGMSIRHLLQTLGTDWGRKLIVPDLWVRSMAARLDTLHYAGGNDTNVVIDDVRFEDEAAFIRERGGLVVHFRSPATVAYGHASEAGIEVGANDAVIYNTGSLDDLKAAVLAAVDRFASGGDELLRLCLTSCATYRV